MYGSQRESPEEVLLTVEEFGDDYSVISNSALHASNQRRQEKIKSHRQFLWKSIGSIVTVSFVALLIVALAANPSGSVNETPSIFSKYLAADKLPTMTLTASNEYGVFTAPYPWLTTVLGTQLVEPYKETTLSLTGLPIDSGLYSFEWIISDFDHQFVDNSSVQTVTFTDTKIYNITINAYLTADDTRQVLYIYSTRLISKYVKRELRSLTIADRESFLDAAATMWKYNSSEGRAIFGDDYTSIEQFVSVHSLSSDSIMCDGFHEGSGFLTRHLALTNAFEASLRSIDPSVTLPYWDFSIEGQQIVAKGELPSYMLEVTPVFSDTWFGSVDSDNHIENSRWAHAQMPKQSNSSMGVHNSYGYIRSYWNNNPDPELTRKLFSTCGMEPVYKTVPSCDDHFDVLDSPSLGNFLLVAAGDAHGPMHLQIGGLWGGCEDAYAAFTTKWAEQLDEDITDEFLADYSSAAWKWGKVAPRRLMIETLIMGKYSQIYKAFWRSHMCAADGTPEMLKCPSSCAQEVPLEECTCRVEALLTNETDWLNLLPCVLNKEDNRAAFEFLMPDGMGSDLVQMMATASLVEGEMIESASTSDIMFWLVHPAIERLLTAKRLDTVLEMAGKPFYKWGEEDVEWFEYSYYSFGVGENLHYNSTAYTCAGHAAADPVLPESLSMLKAITDTADLDQDGVITNWEFYLAIDPNNVEGSDYVFDNFNWTHCTV